MKLLGSIIALAALSTAALGQGDGTSRLKVGDFITKNYGVAGMVFAVGEKTLLIKGFKYTGGGPDAFFWVGTQGTEPTSSGTILPYPFDGTLKDNDGTPMLSGTRFNGGHPHADITITLPGTTKVTDLKWMSVWCRRFGVNFGSFTFPENLSLDMPPAILPPNNDISNAPIDHDGDATPEAGTDAVIQDIADNVSGFTTVVVLPAITPPTNDISNAPIDHDRDASPKAGTDAPAENSGDNVSGFTTIVAIVIAALNRMVL